MIDSEVCIEECFLNCSPGQLKAGRLLGLSCDLAHALLSKSIDIFSITLILFAGLVGSKSSCSLALSES